ncbi:related to Putative lipase YDR444W [Zygosaccharomyces bailii]|nr:related to Putative lipase YDR444W [Zygosaccharomyces bailii]
MHVMMFVFVFAASHSFDALLEPNAKLKEATERVSQMGMLLCLDDDADDDGILLFADRQSVGMGDAWRYRITADKRELESNTKQLYLRIKNTESALLRPVYIAGPYSFYVDVRPCNYDENRKFDEPIQFCCDLRPDEHFCAKLLFNKNSQLNEHEYSWTIDILSQMCVTPLPRVKFRLKIGTTKKCTKLRYGDDFKSSQGFQVQTWDTDKLWNAPPKFPARPVHLVIVTHGIFSNIGCDMLYLKERIEKAAFAVADEFNPNVIVRGCMDIMGKSSHGIRALGVKVGKFVIKIIDELNKHYKIDKLSFVGHSLGGPTQTMAIHYIALKRPDIFDPVTGIKPVNFIALASPFLGVASDVPMFVSAGLTVGTFGLTGRDLTLRHTPLTSKEGLATSDPNKGPTSPVMELLPLAPAREVLERFVHRTLYANVLHDGIVPLRTAALLYLDWRSLAQVRKMRRNFQHPNENSSSTSDLSSNLHSQSPLSSPMGSSANPKTAVIPESSLDKTAAAQFFMPHKLVKYRKYARIQTMSSPSEDSSDSEGNEPSPPKNINKEEAKFNPPPEASTILAAISVITSPLPTEEYIMNPEARTDCIVHDRLYYPNELPPPHYKDRPFYKKLIYPNETSNKLQEEIARSWQESMTWRKVLVDLKPDSHNNIVVRRRFVNLFGNVAINDLAESHFGLEASKRYATL